MAEVVVHRAMVTVTVEKGSMDDEEFDNAMELRIAEIVDAVVEEGGRIHDSLSSGPLKGFEVRVDVV